MKQFGAMNLPINSLMGILENVELRRIHHSSNNLRGEVGPLDELVTSIEQTGLLEPMVVRPAEDGFEVVAGNRRLDACKVLKMSKVPCHIVELDDKEAFEVSLIENVQRETLNPMDEAKAFRKYTDERGYGAVSELASKIGKSHTYVSRRIQLLSLPKEVQDEVVRRRTTPSIAQELSPLDDNKETAEVLEVIHEQHLSTREVRTIVTRRRRKARQEELPPSSCDFQANHPPVSERRARVVDRAIARAVASLRMDMYRLSEVIDDVEDEWVVREVLFQCRTSLNNQMENLMRFRKRLMLHEGER